MHFTQKLLLTLVTIGAVLALPAPTLAATTFSDVELCFLRTSDEYTNTYTLRTYAPRCRFTLEQDVTSNVNVVIENVDPDFMDVEGLPDTVTVTRANNQLTISGELVAGEYSVVVAPWHDEDDDWYFVALSDNQPSGSVAINSTFATILAQMEAIRPVFYTNSGDVVLGSSNTETMRRMYDSVIEALAQKSVPMIPIAGNHDYGSGYGTSIFNEYLAPDNFTFNYSNAHFAGFSTAINNSRGGISEDSLEWLEDALQSSKPHVLAAFHHPVSTPAWATVQSYYLNPTDAETIAGVLDNAEIHTAITGHGHGYDYRFLTNDDVPTIHNGFNQLITGGAGGSLSQPGGKHHYTLMHVTSEGIEPMQIGVNDFGTSVTYSQNNATQRSVTAQVINSGAMQLPYIRLKFVLPPLSQALGNTYVVYDSAGNYYTNYYSKQFNDRTVIYLEQSAPIGTNVTYTAEIARNPHTDRVNTAYSDGSLEYDTFPATRTTAVADLLVQPKRDTTTIEQIVWEITKKRTVRNWTEKLADPTINTDYTVSNLAEQVLYTITVNGRALAQAIPNDSGNIQFSYSTDTAERDYSVKAMRTSEAQSLAMVPAGTNATQLLRYNLNGSALSNWFGQHASYKSQNRVYWGNVDNSIDRELVITNQQTNQARLLAFTRNGYKLAEKTFNTNSYRFGIITQPLRIEAGTKQYVAIIPAAQNTSLQLYRLDGNTWKLVDGTNAANARPKAVRLTTAELDDRPGEELVSVAIYNNTLELRVWQWNNGQLTLLHKKTVGLSNAVDTMQIASGDVSGTGKNGIILLTANGGGSQLWRFDWVGQKLIEKTRYKLPVSGSHNRLAVGNLDDDPADEVLTYQIGMKELVGWQWEARKVNEWFTNQPLNAPIESVTLFDEQQDGRSDVAVAQANGATVGIWRVKPNGDFIQQAKFTPYGSRFNAGIQLAD